MYVKICGITNDEDALFSVSMGADAVGFIFAPSKRQIWPEDVLSIIRRLPPEIMTVGVFKDERRERVAKVVNKLGLKGAQLHGHESREDTAWVAERVSFVIKAFPAGQSEVRQFVDYGADVLLLDSPEPGSGNVFDWSLAEDVIDPSTLMLSGGLNPENVEAAVKRVQPWGVDVTSGVESAPGKKDPVKVRNFIKLARQAATPKYKSIVPREALFDWQEEGI